jgi:4-hydroxy-tetrahydrodipicolinate reductase
MRIGIFGAGRLGTAIADQVFGSPAHQLLWQQSRPGTPGEAVELAIDASLAGAVPAHLDWALATGTDLVIGVTGWQLPDLEARVGQRIGLLVAPNFSLGAALMARLALVMGRFAALDPELDPYVLEHHHRLKADAPSGTARRLAEAVLAGCPRKTAWTLDPPAPEQLSLAVLRAGSELGRHTVGLDGPAESLELTHRARSRALFAQGALQAAAWLRGRKGVFSFDQFAQGLLDPLFQFGD